MNMHTPYGLITISCPFDCPLSGGFLPHATGS